MKKNALLPAYFVVFIDNFGLSIAFVLFAPLILKPIYGLVSADTSAAIHNIYLAILFGSYPLGQFFGAPLLGDFADHFGRKKALYLSLSGTIVGFLLTGVSILVQSYIFLVIIRLFTGLFAGNQSICMAIVADYSPDPKQRSRYLGFIATVLGISWIIAIIIGGYLSDPKLTLLFNPELPFWILGVLGFAGFWIVAKFLEESHETSEKFHVDLLGGFHHLIEAIRIKDVRIYYLVYFMWVLAWVMTMQWFVAYSIEIYHKTTVEAIWWLVGLGITWGLGSSYLNGLIIKRYSSQKITTVSFAILAILLGVSSLTNSYVFFCACFTVGAIFAALAMTNVLNLISTNAEDGVQGKIMGMSASMLAMGLIVSAVVAGFVSIKYMRWIIPLGGIMSAIGFVIVLCTVHKRKSV